MRLARTAAPLPRVAPRSKQVWPAGVEPAISGARSRWGGRLPYGQTDKEKWEEGLASLNRGGALLERLPEPSVARQHACQPPSWTARGMPCPLSDAGCTLRPKHRLGASRCSVTPLGHPSTAQSVAIPPAGLEPAASGLRARRHLLFDHEGVKAPAAGLEPAISRVTTARLPNSTTPERKGLKRKERESNPQSPERRLTRFRDGIPRRWQSFQRWPRQASNLHRPG